MGAHAPLFPERESWQLVSSQDLSPKLCILVAMYSQGLNNHFREHAEMLFKYHAHVAFNTTQKTHAFTYLNHF